MAATGHEQIAAFITQDILDIDSIENILLLAAANKNISSVATVIESLGIHELHQIRPSVFDKILTSMDAVKSQKAEAEDVIIMVLNKTGFLEHA